MVTPKQWRVAELCGAIAQTLDTGFNPVLVRGEVTGFTRASSGHCYFGLKDESAQIRCVMFRRAAASLDFSPGDGELVELQGRLGVYESRGDLQLIVESMSRAGKGALFEQFLKTKARLEAQGLFDAANKRTLPPMPRGIGVVTSLGAAAMHDVMSTLSRRAPHIAVVLAPASVQGTQAPAELIKALSNLYRLTQTGRALDRESANVQGAEKNHQDPVIDVILLVRGGGSLEDLWAFNDEQLVRTLAQSPVPTVSGVGHETDFTLVDLAADLRAPTPTAAAELVARPREVWCNALEQLASDLHDAANSIVDRHSQRLDLTVSRLGRPSAVVSRLQMRLASGAQRLRHSASGTIGRHERDLQRRQPMLARALTQGLIRAQERFGGAARSLSLLDPRLVLQRGYAWLTTGEGQTITSAGQAEVGQRLHAALAQGGLDLTVSGKN